MGAHNGTHGGAPGTCNPSSGRPSYANGKSIRRADAGVEPASGDPGGDRAQATIIMDSQGKPGESNACGATTCPVKATLYPRAFRGETIPPSVAAGIARLDLVPRHCVRCPQWTDRKTAFQAATVHLWGLVDEGIPLGALLRDALLQAREAQHAQGHDPARQLAALVHLKAAYALLEGAGIHRGALEPLLRHRLGSLVKAFLAHPPALFALAGLEPSRSLDEAGWGHYLDLLAPRAEAEAGHLAREGDEATLHARGVIVRLRREGPPAAPPRGALSVAVLSATPSWEGLLDAASCPILVRVDGAAPGVHAPPLLPAWIRRLLDPRPDAMLAADLEAWLEAGTDASVLTEPFLLASDHDAEWPRAVVAQALSGLARRGRGRLRDVPGVGPTLVIT